jgi:hypothetical protein
MSRRQPGLWKKARHVKTLCGGAATNLRIRLVATHSTYVAMIGVRAARLPRSRPTPSQEIEKGGEPSRPSWT